MGHAQVNLGAASMNEVHDHCIRWSSIAYPWISATIIGFVRVLHCLDEAARKRYALPSQRLTNYCRMPTSRPPCHLRWICS